MKRFIGYFQCFVLLGIFFAQALHSAEAFVIQDIRVEGLQRISAGTVFNYLPIKIGQRLEPGDSADVIRALYKTGFFRDVRLEREGDHRQQVAGD